MEKWPVLFHEPSRGQAFQANACMAAALEKGGIPARAKATRFQEERKRSFQDLDESLAVYPQWLFVRGRPSAVFVLVLSFCPFFPFVITNFIPI